MLWQTQTIGYAVAVLTLAERLFHLRKSTHQTINQSSLPIMVSRLCNGLLMICGSFCRKKLNAVFDEIEASILKETNHPNNFEAHSEQRAFLNEIKRERDGIAPLFMAALEHQLASIRNAAIETAANNTLGIAGHLDRLSLVEGDQFDKKQLFTSMIARAESQNNTHLHSLRQRFAVLSGKPPFDNEDLPISPKVLCDCMLEAIQPLKLSLENTEIVASIFERRMLNNFSELLDASNKFLIEHKVLTNLNYTAYRNPELRYKKSAIALKGGKAQVKTSRPTDAQQTNSPQPEFARASSAQDSKYTPSIGQQVQGSTQQSGAVPQRRFSDFRNLLSVKRQQLSTLGNAPQLAPEAQISNANAASTEVLNEILGKLQLAQHSPQNFTDGVQSIKNQIQTQLSSQSTIGNELTLTSEDSDAIDMIGLLLDSAVKNLKSESTTSKLLTMLQAPLISVALKDKTFFDNSVHPARKMLDTLAETGMNWLDVNDRDEKLYENVVEIVSNMSKNFNTDTSSIQTGYEKTDRLLQTLIKKAEAIERRQIEIAKGKERLGIARMRAEETIDGLIANRKLSNFTKSTMLNAWTDALVLTELRHGHESANWLAMKDAALKIICKDDSADSNQHAQNDQELTTHIQESLQLVGYHVDESVAAADRLLHDDTIEEQEELEVTVQAIPAERLKRNKPEFNLDQRQIEFMAQIKSLPFGTWFEFYSKETGKAERRKMAWASHTTHHMLFVNTRGQKIAEMQMEDLAINLSLGFVSIPTIDKRGFIERALDSAYNSLKDLLPGHAKDAK